MTEPIFPCLWFDGQAQEAATFYCSLFEQSKLLSTDPLVSLWELQGVKIMGLNGGPQFKITPSISFFVTCEHDEEIDALWNKLKEGGRIYMDLNAYPWSERYGWCGDRFGVTWQLYKGRMDEVNQKVVPLLLFSDRNYGRAEEAIQFYLKLFPKSVSEGILFYGEEEETSKGKVMHSQFRLNQGVFMAMDGPGNHDFQFNEGLSFVITCNNQEEIDYYWHNLIADGGEEGNCGWCKDKFGVSWQVIPAILPTLMADASKRTAVMQAFLSMKKFDLETLLAI
ncbi:MAG: VOC family protein [Chitinophagaceae bacterium]|nr:VOC family protein [Chitinophagaceae bacterium]